MSGASAYIATIEFYPLRVLKSRARGPGFSFFHSELTPLQEGLFGGKIRMGK